MMAKLLPPACLLRKQTNKKQQQIPQQLNPSDEGGKGNLNLIDCV